MRGILVLPHNECGALFHTMGMTGFDGATNDGRSSPFGMAPVPAPTDATTPATTARKQGSVASIAERLGLTALRPALVPAFA